MKVENPCFHCYKGASEGCLGCYRGGKEWSGDLESETIEVEDEDEVLKLDPEYDEVDWA